jgi:aspartate ammonia-lyase
VRQSVDATSGHEIDEAPLAAQSEAGSDQLSPLFEGNRREQDFLGEREIPDNNYYGVQTIRGRDNFQITGIPIGSEPFFVRAFGFVKKAAAMANRDLGAIDPKVAAAIIAGAIK